MLSFPFRIGCYSHFDQVYEGRLVRRAQTPSPLARAAAEPAVRYEYQGQTFTLDDYLARNPATGLLVARGDTILIERYQYARHDRHRFTSWSMAKTVTAMLIGIALAEGRIRSVDDPAAADLQALAEVCTPCIVAAFASDVLRRALRRGAQWQRTMRPGRLADNTFRQAGSGGVEAVTPFNVRVAPSGTRFYYASVETQVLGLVLRNAVGRPIANDWQQDKIWEPMGAEADATWLIDRAGQEATFCCINAVLRDYARLGLLLAHNGNWRGRQIIPAAWIEDATRGAPRPAAPPAWYPCLSAILRLRLSGLDLRGGAADVHAPRRPWPGDLRRSVGPAGSSWSTRRSGKQARGIQVSGRQTRSGGALCNNSVIDGFVSQVSGLQSQIETQDSGLGTGNYLTANSVPLW